MYYVIIDRTEFIESLIGSKFSNVKQLCLINSFNDLEDLLQIKHISLKFSLENLYNIQVEIDQNIILHKFQEEIIVPYYKPPYPACPSKNFINLFILEEPEFSEEIFNFCLMLNLNLIPTEFHCKLMKKCYFKSSSYYNFVRHQKNCLENSIQKIFGEQKAYGKDSIPLEKIVKAGYLPREALLFRKAMIQTYDIETFEQLQNFDPNSNTIIHATHKLLSVALGNNRGYKKCFVRYDSSHEAAEQLIKNFVDSLEEMEVMHSDSLPDYFADGIQLIEEDLNSDISKSEQANIISMKNILRSFLKMDIYGYNSGGYYLHI